LLKPGTVTAFYVLFPDPWPKKRHHKRRIFKPEIVAAMTTALAPGSRLLVKSDHSDYAEVIREVLEAESGLRMIDADKAFAGLPSTGFERKYRDQNRRIFSFAYESI
jgi:tRNA (guanine-N7-)-methyltransferase